MIESSFFTSLIGFFIVLTPLIFFHELGHYFAAKKTGVGVESFSIGFGPEIFGYTDQNNTRWKFSLIPLGGYVKMKGELINFTKENNKNLLEKDTFLQANLFSRFLIVLSGPLANLILGLHGAGFANISFCKPGTKIIELRTNDTGKILENIGLKNELNYNALEYEPIMSSDNQNGLIEVDLKQIEKLI